MELFFSNWNMGRIQEREYAGVWSLSVSRFTESAAGDPTFLHSTLAIAMVLGPGRNVWTSPFRPLARLRRLVDSTLRTTGIACGRTIGCARNGELISEILRSLPSRGATYRVGGSTQNIRGTVKT